MTENRVTPEYIEAQVAALTFYVMRVADTTTTLAVAFNPQGFSLAVGMSACVDPANYDKEKGEKYAIEDAEKKAREALWQLEGYRLKMHAA